MSGLHKLVVENFQSHEHSEVTFGPGLNVIVGPSDFGKSALVRALRWLFYNEPRGANFIRVGARSCRVTVELDDGARISRLRSASGKHNQYLLQRPGEEELVFEGFNNEIPLEIVQASGIRKVLVDERNAVELNFGAQLEGPFLLTENGAIRAKVIGQLGGVHILDWAQKSTGTDLRRLREEDGQLTSRLAGLESALEGYAHLPALDAVIDSLDQKMARIEAIAAAIAVMEELRRQWQDVSGALGDAGRVLAALGPLDRAEELAQELEAAFVDHRNLSGIASELSQVSQQFETANGRLAALARLGEVEQQLENLPTLLGDCLRLAQLDAEISRTTGQLAQAGRTAGLTAPVPSAEALWQQAEGLCRQWLELARTAGELSAVTLSLQEVDRIVASTGRLEQADSCLTSAAAACQSLHALQEFGKDWDDENRNYQGATLAAERYQQEMKQLLEDYRQLLSRLGRCPVCFGELTTEAVENALSEYR